MARTQSLEQHFPKRREPSASESTRSIVRKEVWALPQTYSEYLDIGPRICILRSFPYSYPLGTFPFLSQELVLFCLLRFCHLQGRTELNPTVQLISQDRVQIITHYIPQGRIAWGVEGETGSQDIVKKDMSQLQSPLKATWSRRVALLTSEPFEVWNQVSLSIVVFSRCLTNMEKERG